MAEPGLWHSRLALRWLVAGDWRAHPSRLLLTALAIAVGVALGFAVHLVNGSALTAFDGALRTVNGAADLQVTAATPLGFDEAVYPRVAAIPGIADASPVVVLGARAAGKRFTLLGLDVIRAAVVTPSLVGLRGGVDTSADAVFDGAALFLSATAIRSLGTRVGAPLEVVANGRAARLRVAGVLPGVADGQAIGVVDIAAAQWRFGRLGRIDRLDLAVSERATGVCERLRAVLPADAIVADDASAEQQGDALSRAYRVNLDMLALVALLTGGFLVYSAQSLSVVRRLREFALVRTLGLSRAGIVATVAAEGVVIGVAGALLGLAGGYALAGAALRLFGGDLGAGYFAEGAVLAAAPLASFGFFALGLIAAIAGSVFPALRASRVAPAAALRNAGDPVDPRLGVLWWPAAALLALGTGAALLPPVANLPLFGFAGMALLLAGGVAGVPWLARRLLAPLVARRIANVPADLAIRHLHGAPGQAATALCGIVASTALMIAMAIMVTSFRGAVDDWLGQILSADLYVRIEGGGGFDRAAQARLAALPGVATIDFSRQITLTLDAGRPPLTLIARERPQAAMVALDRAVPPPGSTPVWVSEPAARLYGWRAGDRIALPLGRGERWVVAGVWRDYSRQQGAVVVAARDYDRLTGDATRNEAAVMLEPGARAADVARAVTAQVPPALRAGFATAEPAVLRRFALQLFDRSFAVTYLLEGVAIVVGLAGVAATMSAQTIARTREFGMLRHVGVSRGQIVAMLASEGALLGLIGAVAGVLLGGVLAQVLIHVINPQSFNWTMATRLPFDTIAGVIAALVAAAAGTAVVAGRRAVAIDAVRAVREDW